MNNIGKLIIKYRKENDVTQQELANILGVSNTAISKWESGTNLPDISLIKPLSELLDVSIMTLIGEDEDEVESAPSKHISKTLLILITIIILLVASITILIFHNFQLKRKNEECNSKETTLVYKISSDDELKLNATAIINGSNIITTINYINYQDSNIGTNKAITATEIELRIVVGDSVIYSSGKNSLNNKREELKNMIRSVFYENRINEVDEKIDNRKFINNLNNAKIEIEYKSDNLSPKIITYPVTITPAFT